LGFSGTSRIEQVKHHVGWWKGGEGVGSHFAWCCNEIQNCSWDR